jgi:hypothetical protein
VALALAGRTFPLSSGVAGVISASRTVCARSPGVHQIRLKTRRNGGFSYCEFPKKKIRAAHAKEKQQIQSTCGYPNRLNLPYLTAGFSGPFENSRVFTNFFWLL